MYNRNVYLKLYGDKSWELYNNNSLELCSKSFKDYSNTFKILFSTSSFKDVLIVGGGDFQLATQVGLVAPLGTTITIVDPCINVYNNFVEYYIEDTLLKIIQDKINANELSFTYKEEVFSKTYPSISSSTFDRIVIDCSEEVNKDTDEIYSNITFIKQVHSLLKPKGLLYVYIPPGAKNMLSNLEKYFTLVDKQSKFIEAWGELATIYEFYKAN